jgi:hypothetical protein
MEWFFIYKIQIGESIYIGSTKNINSRTKEHKRKCCDERCSSKLYTYVRNNGGWKDEYVSIIDTLFCDEITSRNKEQEYIYKYACNLNSYKVAKACHTIESFSKSNLTNNKISTNITMDLSDELKKRKPNMSANSVKTYNSLLRSVYKNVFGNINDVDIKKFEDHKKIMEFLNEKNYGTRKTYLAALVCIAPDVAEYKKQMMEDIKEYNDETSKSELTDKLENSAINEEEIDTLVDKLKRDADLLFKKKSPRLADLMDIQNYIILSLYYGHIVPRRSLDYVELRYQNYDKENQNYLDLKKERFVFNKFKTAQKMGAELKGQQTLDIPPALLKILKKWIAIIPKEIDTLLFNTNLEPLSNVTLNQRLNSLFGGKKGVNSLRHFYLTSKYKDLMIANEEMGNTMESMGSSSAQAKTYIKIHDKE